MNFPFPLLSFFDVILIFIFVPLDSSDNVDLIKKQNKKRILLNVKAY